MKWRIKILFAGGVLALILVGVAMAGPAWVADHAIILSTVVSAIAAVVIACFTFELAGATRGLKVSADEQITEAKALRKIAETQATISQAQTDIARKQKEIARPNADTYKYALSCFCPAHPFEKILLVNRDGTVASLFEV